jgi:hypothetical protein
MSTITTLKSYLVSLGFDSNMGQFHTNFEKPMQDAAALVKKQTMGIAGDVLKWQGAIVGMFGAIAAGVIKSMDKVAMADQEYRLFGERMFMDTAHARNLKVALDALGEPLEAIAFDPELHDRFMQLIADQKEMSKGLGGDYEANMRKIRDIRFEFTRMKVEIQYLAMGGLNAIFKAFGADSGDLLTNLRKFNDWIIHNIPYLSDQFAKYLIPILRVTKRLFVEIWEDIKLASVVFTNFIGLLSGDTSIEGQTASFEKFAKAIEHVIGFLANVAHYIGQVEGMILHLINAAQAAVTGNFSGAVGELKAALGNVNSGSGAVAGATIGSFFGPEGTLIGGGIGYGVGALNQAINPQAEAHSTAQYAQQATGLGSGAGVPDIMALARKIGADTGIPANIIFDQWAHETGDFSNRGALRLNNLAGINVPGGNGKDYRAFKSIEDFGRYFEDLLKSDRYASQGVLNARTIDQYAASLKAGGYYTDSQSNYASGMKYREQEHNTASSITIENINIMQPNATKQEIVQAVAEGVQAKQSKQIARLIPQVQGTY